MCNLFVSRAMVVLAVVGLLGVLGTSAVFASSSTGSQNPDLTVSVSLSPDLVTYGDSIDVAASVTNNTASRQRVQFSVSLHAPGGQAVTLTPRDVVVLAPGQTHAVWDSIPVLAFFPKGMYSLDVSAANRNGASSAAASVEVY